jgi:hypothetical protein
MMKKLSIAEASVHFGVSKEAIHNRVRRGSLQSVIENGVKMVIVDTTAPASQTLQRKKSLHVHPDERYYKLLEEQNIKLQERLEKLENETRSLRDQKEAMLIAEREKIERIYKEKDEQLKNILTTLSSKFMLTSPVKEEIIEEDEVETLDAELEPFFEEEESIQSKSISLKKYLKKQKFSEKKIQKIFARFKQIAKKDDRIIIVGNKYYIDILKYDYSDLIR